MSAAPPTSLPPATLATRTSRIITRVLHHPLAMAVKRRMRHERWRLTGDPIENPPLPAAARSLLFVCLGNICRSPFAGYLTEQRLAAAGCSGWRVSSAGIRTTQSGQSPAPARLAASAFGISLDEHRPNELTRPMAEAHDLILVMEPGQVDALRATYPELADRVQLLSCFDPQARGYERYHIDDPFNGPPAGYARCYTRIDRAVTGLLAALASPSAAAADVTPSSRR